MGPQCRPPAGTARPAGIFGKTSGANRSIWHRLGPRIRRSVVQRSYHRSDVSVLIQKLSARANARWRLGWQREVELFEQG